MKTIPDSYYSHLVAYWPFDEGEGQEIYDSAGSNYGFLGYSTSPEENDPVWVYLK